MGLTRGMIREHPDLVFGPRLPDRQYGPYRPAYREMTCFGWTGSRHDPVAWAVTDDPGTWHCWYCSL